MFSLLLAIIYLAFISLGLPDAVLGAAWPTIYPELGVDVSYAGIVSIIVAIGTIFSSLQSDRLTFRYGAGKITAVSVATTAIALLGFSFSTSFWQLCLWAIPYGLGAGSVDASLNNYVALHYESHHMSWLHCMWGVGASVGPYIMGYALTADWGWHAGYQLLALLQIVLTLILFATLGLWKERKTTIVTEDGTKVEAAAEKPLSMKEILAIPGAKPIMITFFCYCALEQTAILWASSYLKLFKGLSGEEAAKFASLFVLGMTIGRGISGFVTMKLNDSQMIRLGQGIIGLGILILFIPGHHYITFAGLLLIGLGCAPIYPCIIHSTPAIFGADKSQAIIGVQMASAYIGTLLAPPLFGLIAEHISISLFPIYLLVGLVMMVAMYQRLLSDSRTM